MSAFNKSILFSYRLFGPFATIKQFHSELNSELLYIVKCVFLCNCFVCAAIVVPISCDTSNGNVEWSYLFFWSELNLAKDKHKPFCEVGWKTDIVYSESEIEMLKHEHHSKKASRVSMQLRDSETISHAMWHIFSVDFVILDFVVVEVCAGNY